MAETISTVGVASTFQL